MSTMQPEQAALTKAFEVQSGDFSAAGDASAGIKRVLKKLGIDSAVVRRVSIASYEAELNLIIHSHGGQLVLSVTQDRVELVSKDVGPGIEDVNQAMVAGYSTAPESVRTLGFGAGMGLPNMQRVADTFDIQSQLGVGTTIDMAFHLA